MPAISDYLALIIPWHSTRPRFVATISSTVAPLVALQALIASMPQAFDIDFAVGVQLDAVGVRVGRSRQLQAPLPGIFFTWGDAIRGWGAGVWKGPYDTGYGIYTLDDDTFRRLLYAKVLANIWDGTVTGEQAILDAYFTDPNTLTFVEDDGLSLAPENWFTWGDPARGWGRGVWKPVGAPLPGATRTYMSMVIGISGKIPSLIDIGLLGQDLITANPAGVQVTYRITTVDNTPVFGWGVNNGYVGGWGAGSWGAQPAYFEKNGI